METIIRLFVAFGLNLLVARGLVTLEFATSLTNDREAMLALELALAGGFTAVFAYVSHAFPRITGKFAPLIRLMLLRMPTARPPIKPLPAYVPESAAEHVESFVRPDVLPATAVVKAVLSAGTPKVTLGPNAQSQSAKPAAKAPVSKVPTPTPKGYSTKGTRNDR